MNVSNILNDKKEFNDDGTYNGAYGDMVQVPKSLYKFMLSSSQQILPAVNKHVIAQNVTRAKQNASDPKAYRYYMNQAALYKKYNVNNPDMDQRIRQSLTDPELQRLEGHIKRLRTSPALKTNEGMKHYQNLQIERERRYKVLEDSEHEKFRQFINNPSNNIAPGPESMSDTPYHSRVLKSFLASHPDMIQSDVTGNLYVLGKKISDDPKQAGRIMHFITHDYSDLKKAPEGTTAVINALRKKGFNIKDVGNSYLREYLQRKIERKRTAAQQPPPVTPPPSASSLSGSSSSSSRTVSSTPLSTIGRRTPKDVVSDMRGDAQQLSHMRRQIQHLQKRVRQQQTPSTAREALRELRGEQQQGAIRRKRLPHDHHHYETKTRTDGEYYLRSRVPAKEEQPKKKAKRSRKK